MRKYGRKPFLHAWLASATIVASLVGMCTPVFSVSAAPLKGYEAMQVAISGSGTLTLKPGESKTVSIELQNLGPNAWSNTGKGFVSLYTYGPKYRTSVFQDASWFSATQPAKLQETTVAKGAKGHIVFTVKAPQKEGQYQETFALAAEDLAWIPGGQFTLNLVVAKAAASTPLATTPASGTTTPVASTATGLSGLILIRSAKTVTAKGGEVVSYTVGVKNTGTVSWKSREIRLPDVGMASAATEETYDASWASSRVAYTKSDTEVLPGSLELVTFSFRAPRVTGSHAVRYVFAANGTAVPDLFIDIPVDVTSNAPDAVESPVRNELDEPVDLMDEPILRVGVLIVDEETDWQVDVSCEVDWKLTDTNGRVFAEMDAGERAKAFYKDGQYWYDDGENGLLPSSLPIRFVPDERNRICTVENFDRRVTRGYTHPDNAFRNNLELRYNSTKDRTWLINELPIEFYLRGLAETSNISHLEFQKTLVTVARTYALYHWERGTKRGPEGFHVTAYSDDQVYNGYGQEARSPRLVSSVEATRGRVVTYEGKTAITPYFSRSDGRTRDWGEVWHGDVPWLKGVPAPCDIGKTLWGHGVGLSASEALCQANNGKEWDEILHYFYTDVDLTKRWE